MTATLTIVALILALGLGTLLIWSRKELGVRTLGLALCLSLPLFTWGSLQAMLSHPKPIEKEFFLTAKEADVLGSHFIEGTGIYLWLLLPGVPEPRYYVMLWDTAVAEELQRAREEAEKNQTAVKMRLPFEDSMDDRKPKFYPMPQPQLPPKPAPEAPTVYEQPA